MTSTGSQEGGSEMGYVCFCYHELGWEKRAVVGFEGDEGTRPEIGEGQDIQPVCMFSTKFGLLLILHFAASRQWGGWLPS